jgi:hypothetical protein
MGQSITLAELICIASITLFMYAFIKTIIEEYQEKINH